MKFPNSEPLAASGDPITSQLAGDSITASGKRDSDKLRVLNALRTYKMPVTSAELAADHGLDRYMVARRLPDLREDGLAEQLSARKCKVNGRLAVTWFAAEFL